ncbi:MAG: hypothetical protein HRU13_12230, partial [Phycisphaerales bacterium]|nr:hypothetical protein [Phycisphaerales bacterium]
GYFPTTITRLTGDGDSQCVFLLEADQRTVYGFRVSWAGREKVQQAWFTWTFGTDILDISCMGGNLWMLTRDNDRFALEKLPILGEAPTEGIPWEVHLDRQFSVTGVDNGSNTRFSVPGLIADTSTIDAFVLGSTFGDTGFEITAADTGAWTYAGAADNIDVPDASDIYRAGPVVMGTQYEMLSEPSRPYFRTDSGQAILGTATRSNRQVVRLSGGLAVLTTDPTPSNFTSTTKTFDPGDGSILERDAIMTSLLSFDNATFTITSTDARPLEIHYVGFQCSPGRPT